MVDRIVQKKKTVPTELKSLAKDVVSHPSVISI
jgi:hypothetical protein